MQVSRLCLAASLIAIVSTSAALAGEDIGAGQEIYQAQCSACHSNQPGVNGIGPSLAGVAGRKAGSLPGFHFTPALQGSGLDGKQYVATTSGTVSAFFGGSGLAAVVIFALP